MTAQKKRRKFRLTQSSI